MFAELAKEMGIPVARKIPFEGGLSELNETINDLKNAEGFVVYAHGVPVFKYKGQWYLDRHSVIDKIAFEHKIVSLILDEELDDIIGFLDKTDYGRIKELEKHFWECFNRKEEELKSIYVDIKHLTRKDIAQKVIPKVHKMDGSFVFGQLDGKNLRNMMLAHTIKHVHNSTRYETLKKWLKM